MVTFRSHLLSWVMGLVVVTILLQTGIQLYFSEYLTQKSSEISSHMALSQVVERFESRIRLFKSALIEEARQKIHVRYIIDDSNLNRIVLEEHLDGHEQLVGTEAEYALFTFDGVQTLATEGFAVTPATNGDNPFIPTSILENGERDPKKAQGTFTRPNLPQYIFVVAPIMYHTVAEGYLVAQVDLRKTFDDLYKRRETGASVQMFVGPHIISALGGKHERVLRKSSQKIPSISFEVSFSDKAISNSRLLVFSLTIVAALALLLVMFFVVNRWILPRTIKPIIALSDSMKQLSHTGNQSIENKSKIMEIFDLEKQFNDLLSRLNRLNKDNLDQAHKAGMAEIAVGILHNIGNITTGISMRFAEYPIVPQLEKASTLLSKLTNAIQKETEEGDITHFLTKDETGMQYLTGLSTISGLIQEKSKQVESDVAFVEDQVSHIGEIINSQQQIARGGTIMKTDVDLESVIDECLVLVNDKLEKNKIKLSKNLTTTSIYLNRFGFSQLVMNLLVNAIESIAEQESITTKNLDGHINISLTTKANQVIFAVTDNGKGLDEETKLKLFTFGFSTKRRSSGYGLHNCANFVEENNGKISIESDGIGLGANATIIFVDKPFKDA